VSDPDRERTPCWQRALAVGGVAAGLAGAAYAVERAVVAGTRRRPDPDAGRELVPRFDEALRLPSHDHGSIYTISRGSGPPVVLAHGVTLSTRVWVKQFEAMPEMGFRTLAFDQRGHGDSECGTGGYTVEGLAADVRTVLEELDLRNAVLVGHSLGGLAVQAFAILHPEVARKRVRGLVLMSTFARLHVSGEPRLKWLIEQLAERGPHAARMMAQPNIGFLIARIGFGRDPQPSHVELTRDMIAACPRDTQRGFTTALVSADLTPHLPTIDRPTLVLGGTADLLTPPAEARQIADLVPGARLEMFRGAGHMLMLERSEEVNALVAEFARDVGARAPRRRWWTRRPPPRHRSRVGPRSRRSKVAP
jgi:non-heme chloroperoxidase